MAYPVARDIISERGTDEGSKCDVVARRDHTANH